MRHPPTRGKILGQPRAAGLPSSKNLKHQLAGELRDHLPTINFLKEKVHFPSRSVILVTNPSALKAQAVGIEFGIHQSHPRELVLHKPHPRLVEKYPHRRIVRGSPHGTF